MPRLSYCRDLCRVVFSLAHNGRGTRSLFVVVFPLMLDRKNHHRAIRWFVAVQREVAARAEVDNQIPQFRVVFNRTSDDWSLFERKERFANGEHCPVRGVDIFFEKEIIEPRNIALCSCRQDYSWHTGMEVLGFCSTASTHALNSSSEMCKPVSL